MENQHGFVACRRKPPLTQTYTYDKADRLTDTLRTGSSDHYEYDNNGNRTLARLGSLSNTFTPQSSSNRLLSISGSQPQPTIVYDLACSLCRFRWRRKRRQRV